MKALYAITGSAFFLAAFAALISVGDVEVRRIAIIGALLAGYSQFAAQDDSNLAHYLSLGSAYAAMASAVYAAFLL